MNTLCSSIRSRRQSRYCSEARTGLASEAGPTECFHSSNGYSTHDDVSLHRTSARATRSVYEESPAVGRIFYTPGMYETRESLISDHHHKHRKPRASIIRVSKTIHGEAEDAYLGVNVFVLPTKWLYLPPFLPNTFHSPAPYKPHTLLPSCLAKGEAYQHHVVYALIQCSLENGPVGLR